MNEGHNNFDTCMNWDLMANSQQIRESQQNKLEKKQKTIYSYKM